MKKTLLILFTLFLVSNIHGQVRRNRMGTPQVQSKPSEQDIEKRKRMIEERKQEYISNFLTTLEADEFQKEIIRQNLNTFYDAKLAILQTPFDRSFDRQNAIKKLESTHFEEIETLISKSDMDKIKEMITGDFDEKEVKKEKKKKKKRKKNKDN